MQRLVDARPLGFVRMTFGLLMIVYSANKCSDDLGNQVVDDMSYGFEQRMPYFLSQIGRSFPFYTDSHLYWHIHAPLMLLTAVGMAYGRDIMSRISCIIFAILKMILTMHDATVYNNHEYLYSVLALILGLLGGHNSRYVYRDVLPKHSMKSSQITYEQFIMKDRLSFLLTISGTAYMTLKNVVYGIPGHIGMLGMIVFIWPGVLLALCHPCNRDDDDDADADAAEMIQGETVPYWHILYMRIFIGSLYLFAGFAKTDYDWLSGQTVKELFRLWTGPTCNSYIRDLILQGGGDTIILFVTYGGLFLDLMAIIALNVNSLYIRIFAVLAVASFHIINHWTFIIETFPWVMLSALVVHFHHELGKSYHKNNNSEINGIIDIIGYRILYQKVLLEYMRIDEIWDFISLGCSYIVPVLLMCMMVLHLLIPLPCALYSIGDDGSLVWGSQCSFFKWRMMTRSVKTLSTQIRLHDPISNRIDYIPMLSSSLYPDIAKVKECTQGTSLERYGFERDLALNTFLQESAAYEDRISFIIKDTLDRAIPIDSTKIGTPKIYADIWIEINGPPYQRYIDPSVDLAIAVSNTTSTCASNEFLSSLFSKPVPLTDWVLPRLTTFRTKAWLNIFQHLESKVTNSVSKTTMSANVLFLADHPNKGLFRLVGDYKKKLHTEIILLSGEATVLNAQDSTGALSPLNIKAGTCIRHSGMLLLQSMNSEPTLWMIVNEKYGHGQGLGAGRAIGVGGDLAAADMKAPLSILIGNTDNASDRAKFEYCYNFDMI